MKEAILLISFGTSYREAREKSLDRIFRDLEAASGGRPVFLAYTSGMIVEKLEREEKLHIDTVREAVRRAHSAGAERLYVIPTHMIPGMEYDKMARELKGFADMFLEIKIASPVLGEEADCKKLVSVLEEMLRFDPEKLYILMGHGSESSANVRYAQMNQALERAGLPNVRIASAEARPDLEDALRFLSGCDKMRQVIVQPFMVVAGEHAHNDMAGAGESYVSRIGRAGHPVCAVVKGLGEYPQFRAVYVRKLKELTDGK